ncbi:MAG: hypothetical protein AAB780_00435, partial [Patescibacteria group bacterium]
RMKMTEFRLKHVFILVGFLLLTLYSLFQARFLILGPQVAILSHEDGAVATEPQVLLSGTARNAAWISLNDRQIFTDEEGHWSEKLILSEGLSIMTLRVRDRFGRESSDSVRLILN